MRYCFIFLSLCFSLMAQAQWSAINPGTKRNLTGVFFPSSQTGYIVTFNGPLLRTSDGGATWDSLNTINTGNYISHLWFTDDSTGYVTTLKNNTARIYKTTNSGNNWTDLTPDTNMYGMLMVKFLDKQKGFLFSNSTFNGRLWTTENGGSSWGEITTDVNLSSGTVSNPSFHFHNQDTGILTGADGTFAYRGVISRTTDAGATWNTTTLSEVNSLIIGLHFPQKDTGYTLSGNGLILRTVDGGASWDSVHTLNILYTGAIYFINGSEGYVITEKYLYKTTDAGQSWNMQTIANDQLLNDIFFISPDTGFIVGDSGVLMRTPVTSLGLGNKLQKKQSIIYPNPAKDNFTITGLPAPCSLHIYNMTGVLITKTKVNNGEKINLGLPEGLYYYFLENAEANYVSTGKLLIQW